MNDFPAYRSYGVPVPAGAVARIVEGPHWTKPWSSVSTGWSRWPLSSAWRAPGADGVNAAATEVGVTLLGDRGLVDDVCAWLGDGPAEGDVLRALGALYELGEIELGPAMRAELIRAGVRLYPAE